MKRNRLLMNRALTASPWLTVLVLVAMSMALPNRSELTADAELRKEQVAQAVEAVPLFIGQWVGEDASDRIPREAQQLLRPNAIMSRWYQDSRGRGAHILVVHCGDARDMIGHYPPVCYPSSGWIQVPIDQGELEVELHGREFPIRQYRFRLMRDHGRVDHIRILNAFILPDGTVTRDIDDVSEQSARLAVAIQGVAQIQFVTTESMSQDAAIQSAKEILGGMTDLFTALGIENEVSDGT